MIMSSPERLWLLSSSLAHGGKTIRARLIKAYLFFVFKAVLPPEAVLNGVVKLGHFGMGVVVHPNTTIGRDVMIWHGVTLSVRDSPGAASRLTIGDRVEIGTGTVISTALRRSLRICDDVRIGANSTVTKDILEPGVYAGSPLRLLKAGVPASECID